MTEQFVSELKEVASSGDENAFQLLLRDREEGISLESGLTEQGSTVLMILAAMGRQDLISSLLNEVPSPAIDQANCNGTTALVFACSMGHFSAMKLLCEHGADVNWTIGSHDTPLTVSAAEGFDDIVAYLITTRGAKLESHNETGQTALHCACHEGHLSTASLLLQEGAAVEAADNFQATPLVVACANGFVDIARLLLQRGASTSCVSESILTSNCDREEAGPATANAAKAALISLLREYAWLPALDLQRACRQDDVPSIRRLLEAHPAMREALYSPARAGPHIVYGGGASPLMVACLHNSLQVVRFFLGEYPQQQGGEVDPKSLVEVRLLCCLAIGGFFFSSNHDLHSVRTHVTQARSEDGRTCLFYSAWSGALPILQFLAEEGHVAELINAKNQEGRSALYYACHNGHTSCVSFFLSSGAAKENITPGELADMPMQHSVFQSQNSSDHLVPETVEAESGDTDANEARNKIREEIAALLFT